MEKSGEFYRQYGDNVAFSYVWIDDRPDKPFLLRIHDKNGKTRSKIALNETHCVKLIDALQRHINSKN